MNRCILHLKLTCHCAGIKIQLKSKEIYNICHSGGWLKQVWWQSPNLYRQEDSLGHARFLFHLRYSWSSLWTSYVTAWSTKGMFYFMSHNEFNGNLWCPLGLQLTSITVWRNVKIQWSKVLHSSFTGTGKIVSITVFSLSRGKDAHTRLIVF